MTNSGRPFIGTMVECHKTFQVEDVNGGVSAFCEGMTYKVIAFDSGAVTLARPILDNSFGKSFVPMPPIAESQYYEYFVKEYPKEEDLKRQQSDPVNHPSHYTSDPSGVECIEITRHRSFNVGNAIKYLWRAGLKHEEGMADKEKQIQDLKKAIFYINDEIALLEGKFEKK